MKLEELDNESLIDYVEVLQSLVKKMEEKMEYFRSELIECEKRETRRNVK